MRIHSFIHRHSSASCYAMVPIEDGRLEHAAHVLSKLGLFLPRKKIRFDDSFDVTKCLHQIEIPDLLQMCSELPSNISTMCYTFTIWEFEDFGLNFALGFRVWIMFNFILHNKGWEWVRECFLPKECFLEIRVCTWFVPIAEIWNLYGDSEIGSHVMSNLCYLTC